MFPELLKDTPWPQQKASRTALGPFSGSAEARCIAELARPGQLLLVITADTSSALTLERELPFFLEDDVEILAFPDWETLPYDNFSPHQDIISERLSTLHRLRRMTGGILVVPIPTLMHRLAPTDYIAASSLVLAQGQTLDIDSFRRDLQLNGYLNVETVYEHGEFALRGSLFDIYPMGSKLPYRIDLLDAEVDSLRTFDPETQRTVDKVERINLLPGREYPLDKGAISRFQMNWYEAFEVDPDQCAVYVEVSAGRSPGGCEYYLPLFFKQCSTLFDYLPDNTAIIACGDHHGSACHFWDDVNNRFEEYGIDPRRPLLPPRRCFTPVEELYQILGNYAVLELRHSPDAPVHRHTAVSPPPDLGGDQRSLSAAAHLVEFIREHGGPVLLCAESAGRREILLESLREHQLEPPAVPDWHAFIASGADFAIATAPLDRGMYFGPGQPTLVCEAQLFGNRVAQRRRRGKRAEDAAVANVFRDINELREGVPVVHIEHGVGRYVGLQTLTVDDQEAEFLTLEYAQGSRLYVPVASLHLVSRYAGSDPELAPLHKLGSDQWDKARRKASEKASDVAAQLLEVYARREAREGFAFAPFQHEYEQFAAAFPFEETPDQQSTIDAVIEDMQSPRVMDRLVCGDVGFGKTEVAMRAAFLATRNKKQVAVLVPTTLLAQQHFNSFSDRFADWDVSVEVVSRFKSGSELARVTQRVATGKTDILIGTHKLLQSGFHFADLGLLIIDEEHRFGVKQKETIKALRSEVDVLTLTATPIPRTLNMAMGGMRDLSIIATPPARRLSIKTFVREHNIALIKEAVLRETLRGGQVYYLHNEVKTIEETARKLRELLPDLSIAVAHGQMRETQLEQVMLDFYHRRFNILLCTTIIESGIDVPTANTILINRADRLGLAQLHQLRGRVGRSHHRAYAYLMVPHRSAMTPDAIKRIEAIESLEDLGAGFTLATHDLEIRGAGELLGEEQSGQIQEIGFTLYSELLERAVAALKAGRQPQLDRPLNHGPEVDLHIPALIPEDYLPDVHGRLILYKRIASAADRDELRELQVEMIDRFGLLPAPVKQLFAITELKLKAVPLGIARIDVSDRSGRLIFGSQPDVDPTTIIRLIQGQPQHYNLDGSDKIRFQFDMADTDTRIARVSGLLDSLSPRSD